MGQRLRRVVGSQAGTTRPHSTTRAKKLSVCQLAKRERNLTMIVELTQGLEAIVDDSMAELVSKHRWMAMRSQATTYACTRVRDESKDEGWRTVLLHRLVSDAAPKTTVHHRNGDGLDCRLENLEVLFPKEHRARHPDFVRPQPRARYLAFLADRNYRARFGA